MQEKLLFVRFWFKVYGFNVESLVLRGVESFRVFSLSRSRNSESVTGYLGILSTILGIFNKLRPVIV